MRSLFEFFERSKTLGKSLVLATVVATEGSTYSKIGERLLVDESGAYRGLLSGGCLEGDLSLRARQVLATGEPQRVSYDFRGEDDLLFGMGVGCEGAIAVFLQRLHAANDYQPFTAIMQTVQAEKIAVLATALDTERCGASYLFADDGETQLGLRSDPALSELCATSLASQSSSRQRARLDSQNTELLLTFVRPPPRMLVLGGGPDVLPLIGMANELEWRSTVVDHRPTYVERLPEHVDRRLIVPSLLSTELRIDDYDRAVVMSHHLETDRCYLEQLAESAVRYIGLLGPPARHARLVSELGPQADKLGERLYGPAGLDIGGRGPAVIALSILAQMQQQLP